MSVNVDEIRTAIRAKLIADVTLVNSTHLDGEHVYQFAQRDLQTDTLEAWVTIFCATHGGEDPETSHATQLWQVDVYAIEAARAERIASRIVDVLAWSSRNGGGTLPGLTTRRLAEPIYEEPAPAEQVDDMGNGSLSHKTRQFRVATYALA